jgi:ABC-type multidrug transport system fused ATPase/permease subunit
MSEDLLATSAETWREGGDAADVPSVLTRARELRDETTRVRLAGLRERYLLRQQRALDYFAATRAPERGLPVAPSSVVVAFVRDLMGRRRRVFAALVVMNVLAGAAGLLVPKLLGNLVDGAVRGGDTTGSDRIAAVVAGIVVLQAVATFGARRVSVVFGQGVLASARERIVRFVLALPLSRIESSSSGDLVTRVTRDVQTMSSAARDALPAFILEGVLIALSFVAIVANSPLLAVPTLVSVGLLVFVVRWYLRRATKGYVTEGGTYSRINSTITETVEGARTLEALGLEGLRAERTDGDLAVSGQAERYTLTLRNLLFTTLDYAFQGPLIGIVLLGTWGYANGLVTLGQITAAALYSQQMYGPIDHMIQILDRLQMALASTTRLLGIAQVPADRVVGSELPDGVELVGEDLHFAYRAGHDVLHGVSLDLTPGERLAIVGPSGSGKSTLGRLLAGINAPRSGSVTVGGVEATRLPLPVLRTEVALVTQEHHVFVGSLRDNIVLAREDSDDVAVREALGAVGATDWVDRLPDGLGTTVGSGHHQLTPAQAQQVALARLVLADPHTLVLDEATSLIDPRTARTLEGSMHALLTGRTVVAIAHRLHTAHDADRIAVVIDGRIAELGSHSRLLELDGEYAALWRAWTT